MISRALAAACVLLLSAAAASAQELPDAPLPMLQAAGGGNATHSLSAPEAENDSKALTVFSHSDDTPWFVAGQVNIIFQAHPGFHSPYQGPNSFRNGGEYKTSLLGTLYTGYQLDRFLNWGDRYHLDGIFDGESAGGRGLSQALGIAGFTNLDVVRNPYLSTAPYVGRAELHATIGFSDEMTDSPRGPLSFATRVSVRRLELRVGKMSVADIFDLNDILSDSHLQFTNWAVDNNGAWDYAADTRGYTYAATAEYQDRNWAVRYGLALMPTVANGIDLDWAISRAKGQNWEGEWRHGFLPGGRRGTQRVLAFRNNAHMGDYREAVQAYVAGVDATPTITLHERFGAVKYGFGYNMEQWITEHFHVGGRFGWNEGQHETWAYTEIDQTFLVGGEYEGAQWHRKDDQIGVAFVSNAIKKDHQNYLADGGLGFILGDGRLHYGRENTEEAYYNLHARSGLYFALGLSHVDDPGYNRDRGPVWVPSVRAHVDF